MGTTNTFSPRDPGYHLPLAPSKGNLSLGRGPRMAGLPILSADDPVQLCQPLLVFRLRGPRSSQRSGSGARGWRRDGARGGARARQGQQRGVGGGAPACPPAARAPNGPSWGREVTVAARGSWEATPSLQSREVPEGRGGRQPSRAGREVPSAPVFSSMSRTPPLLSPRGGDPGRRWCRAQP